MIRLALFLSFLACFLSAERVPACNICGGQFNQLRTLRQDWERAKLVLVGTLSNPRFPGGAGAGATDLNVERTLKRDGALAVPKLLTLNRYIPVLDPKSPPTFAVFCDLSQGKLDPFTGREVHSKEMLEYLRDLQSLRGKDQTQRLQFFYQFLDHADVALAEDAFVEFARSTDAEVGQAAPTLAPEKLRRLVRDPKTSADRLSLFAFLLGASGKKEDAALLRSLIDQPNERNLKALDGLLCGYICAQPHQGWKLALTILGDRKRPFPERYAAVRTLRFYSGWKPGETKPAVLAGYRGLVEDGEMADLAIEDLRRWKIWDMTGKVLAQYGKRSHSSPIIQRSIVRYALSCPLMEAAQFVASVRRQDAELVRDLEEGLGIEKK